MDQKLYNELVAKFRLNEKDNGSTAIQIINLTDKIIKLTEHVKMQKKDVSAKRTLLQTVAMRKRYLKYLKTQHYPNFSYTDLIQALNLKA